jgi:hypothetical protein
MVSVVSFESCSLLGVKKEACFFAVEIEWFSGRSFVSPASATVATPQMAVTTSKFLILNYFSFKKIFFKYIYIF